MPLPWLGKNLESLALILAMGLLSGVAQFWINVRNSRERMNLATLIGECVISGSASLIAGLALIDHVPQGVVFAVAGIAGHMGTRFLFLVENALSDRIANRSGKKGGSHDV
jgi:sugar phosphate permease